MNSRSHQTKIKRLTLLAKSLNVNITKIPNALPKPGSDSFKSPTKGDAKSDTKRKDDFTKKDAFRLDKSTIRYLADMATVEDTRRKG